MSTNENIKTSESLSIEQQKYFDSLSEMEQTFFWSKDFIIKQKVSIGCSIPYWIQNKIEYMNQNNFPIISCEETKEDPFITWFYEYDISEATFEQRKIIWNFKFESIK